MVINDVLEIVHCAYPGELTRRYWDAEKLEVINPPPGSKLDPANELALCVVREVVNTHPIRGAYEDGVSAAAEIVRDMSFILADVAEALERTLEA